MTAAPSTNSTVSAGNWIERNITNPTRRSWEAMAYDATDGYVVMFGGTGDHPGDNSNYPPLNDTWIYRNQTWREICSGTSAAPACSVSPSAGAATMAYDPAEGYVLLLDSSDHSWAFQGGGWRALNTSANPSIGAYGQDATAMVYDPAERDVLMIDSGGNTWTFAEGNWTKVSDKGPALGYSYDSSLYYDGTTGQLVLLEYDDYVQWFLNGTWTPVNATNTPKGQVSAGVYDPPLGGALVLLSGKYGGGPASTWLLQGTVWTNLSLATTDEPSPQFWSVATYDAGDGYPLFFDGTSVYGFADYDSTWAFINPFRAELSIAPTSIDLGQRAVLNWSVTGGWSTNSSTVIGVPPGCVAGANGVPLSCIPTSSGTFTFELKASNPGTNSTAEARVILHVYPAFEVTASATPTNVTEGYLVDFDANLAGGRTPYLTNWSFGDGSFADSSVVTHVFGTAGAHYVSFTASDSLGGKSVIPFTVWVNSPLVVSATANVSLTETGVPVRFAAHLFDGTAPYQVWWDFGDGNSTPGLEVTHAYARLGVFEARAEVTDAGGYQAAASVAIIVDRALSVVLTAANDTLSANGSLALTASIVGGVGPFVFNWTSGSGQAGNGDTNGSTILLNWSYPAPANYTAELAVTDSLGLTYAVRVHVEVQATPPPAKSVPPPVTTRTSPPSSGPPWWIAAIVDGSILAAAWAGIFVYWRRTHPQRPRSVKALRQAKAAPARSR